MLLLRKNISSVLEKMSLTAKRQVKQDGIGGEKRRNVIHRVGWIEATSPSRL